MNGMYFFDISNQQMANAETEIRAWNSVTNTFQSIVNVNELAKDHIKGYSDCLSSTFDGNFFQIGKGRWGFLFYYGGYFLTGEGNKIKLQRTIDQKPFRKYELRTVDMSGSMKATMCYSETNTVYNFTAASDNEHIYVLSGVIAENKELFAPIDVYSAKDYTYEYTLQAPMKDKEDYAFLMAVSGNNLYLYYKNSKLLVLK